MTEDKKDSGECDNINEERKNVSMQDEQTNQCHWNGERNHTNLANIIENLQDQIKELLKKS